MKYFLIVVFVGISIFSFAEKTVSQVTYEAEVDKLNCELAKYYMKKSQGSYALSAYEDSLSSTGCNFEHLMVFIKERQPEMEINGELAVYIESYKNNYESAVNNTVLYNKLIEIFNQPTLDRHSTDDSFITLKTLLKDQLKRNLEVETVENPVNQEKTEDEEGIFDSFKNLDYGRLSLILVALAIVILFVMLISWFYKYSTTGKVMTANGRRKQTTKTTSTTTINESYTEAKTPVQSADVLISNEVLDEATDEKAKEMTEATLKSVADVQDDELPNKDIFYMSYPSIDGSFYEYAKHDVYKEGKSTFKFELKLKEYNLATFEVISNQDVITDALMNFEKTLNAVCEVIGTGTKYDKNHEIIIKPGLKRIITLEPGTVQLQTQHWRLRQKAKIKLEY